MDKKHGFERHKFPRDSGCFASSSSPASDRSSQPSQSESGIQPDDLDIDLDCYSADENNISTTPTSNANSSASSQNSSTNSNNVRSRPSEKSAQTRNLRDRHGSTVNTVNDLEKLSINVQHVYETSNNTSSTNHNSMMGSMPMTSTSSTTTQNNSKDNFDVLVEKYVTEKTPLQVTPGRVSSTRSIFETSTSTPSGGTCN